MTTFFTEEQVVSTVTRLTRRKLVRYIEGGVVKPQKASDGFVFAQIDIARLELLCDLTDDLNLDAVNLGRCA